MTTLQLIEQTNLYASGIVHGVMIMAAVQICLFVIRQVILCISEWREEKESEKKIRQFTLPVS